MLNRPIRFAHSLFSLTLSVCLSFCFLLCLGHFSSPFQSLFIFIFFCGVFTSASSPHTPCALRIRSISLSKSPILVEGSSRHKDIYYPPSTATPSHIPAAAAAVAAAINAATSSSGSSPPPSSASTSTPHGSTITQQVSSVSEQPLALSDAGKRVREEEEDDEDEDFVKPPLKRQTHEESAV